MKSVLLLLLSLVDARVTTLDGNSLAGQISGLNSEAVIIQPQSAENAAAGVTKIPLAEVIEIQFAEASPALDDGETLLLQDESRIPSRQVTVSASEVSAESEWLSSVKLPRNAVRAIRLQPLQSDWVPQWEALLARSNDRDLLIRVRRDNSGLDFIDGVVSSITAQQVTFLLDGDEIPVPRERVFGVIFTRQQTQSPLSGSLTVFHGPAAVVKARTVQLNDSDLQVQTSWGQQVSIGVSHVSRIDFSSSRFHYLSDLDPIEERYFGTQPAGSTAVSVFPDDEATRTGPLQFWKMSRDAFPYGDGGRPPLMLRGKVYRKGLCLFPQARIVYALDGKYTRLTADVGVDDEVAFNSPDPANPYAVALTVEADGSSVWQGMLKAPAEPVLLDLDVTGVQTLTLLVDFGDEYNFCDYLDLADARLILASQP